MAKKTPFITGILISFGYMAVTLPFLMTDFLGRGLYAGPGYCFPVIMGLLFGRIGILGCLIGCLGGILLFPQSSREAASQLITTAWLSTFPFLLWYMGKNARQVTLSTGRDFIKYALLSLVTSGGAGFIYGICLKDPRQMSETWAFTFFWCIAVGIPVIILMLSILGIQPCCPLSAQIPDDLELKISGYREEIGLVNDRIGETVLLSVTYCGSPYNPLRTGRREQMEDQIGLILIRQMSLRAAYRRVHDENQIKIVM